MTKCSSSGTSARLLECPAKGLQALCEAIWRQSWPARLFPSPALQMCILDPQNLKVTQECVDRASVLISLWVESTLRNQQSQCQRSSHLFVGGGGHCCRLPRSINLRNASKFSVTMKTALQLAMGEVDMGSTVQVACTNRAGMVCNAGIAGCACIQGER